MCRPVVQFSFLGFLTIASGFGCSKQETFIPPIPAPVPLHSIPNPEYDNWSQFPVGTTVVRLKEITNPDGVVRVTTTLKLLEKSDKQVVVESQIDVVRPDSTANNPAQLFEFPSKYQVPETMAADSYSLPAPTAKKTVEEKMAVAGREFDAEVYEWEGAVESGKIDLKLWRSNSMPGRQIKQLIDYRRDNGETANETIVELIIPEIDS